MKFKIPCVWQVYGNLEIEADNLEKAIEQAEAPATPLPENGVYVEDSFEVDTEAIEVLD